MAQDAAASGAQSDADSSKKGENTDAGSTGESSQPDIEKIVAARVAQKLRSYGDLEDLKRKAGEFDTLTESQKTETQKLADRIAALETEKANLERERGEERLRSATVRAAAKLGYADPEDAYALVRGDLKDDADVDKLLSDLLKAKPYLSSNRVSGTADGGQHGAPSDGKKPTMNELLRAAAGNG